jgi:hypothetical protein
VTDDAPPARGDRSRNLKILDARLVGSGGAAGGRDVFAVSLEGRAGERYRLEVHRPDGSVTYEQVLVPELAGDARDGYGSAALRLRP